jgi:hypothetical protein
MGLRIHTSRRLHVALAAALLLGSILAALPVRVMPGAGPISVSAGSEVCTITSIWYPYKISGPAVRGAGSVSCPWGAESLFLEVEIYMWKNNVWNRVARNWSSCVNCTGSKVVATTGLCANTRQYFTQVRAQWTDFQGHPGDTGWRYSTVKWITCS